MKLVQGMFVDFSNFKKSSGKYRVAQPLNPPALRIKPRKAGEFKRSASLIAQATMHLTSEQVLALTERALREFLSLGIPEGLHLDYKEALSGTTEKETKREF